MMSAFCLYPASRRGWSSRRFCNLRRGVKANHVAVRFNLKASERRETGRPLDSVRAIQRFREQIRVKITLRFNSRIESISGLEIRRNRYVL